jgi:hypothetical protein
MSLVCQSDLRRDAVRSAGRNGLDYVEVVDGPPTQLYVYFLDKLPPELAKKKPGLAQYLELAGGDRITGLKILDVAPQAGVDDEHDDFLVVTVDRVGDFSTYTLSLAGVAGIDPQYASASFTFRIDCASDLDCKPAGGCEPAALDEPTINYLAKDYASFRQLIFDRMALLAPDWTERHVPDLGATLVELLAYAGDYLSYYQDAVATEAYLGTARERISVRRHVRLVDYHLHEGCNARAWVQVAVSSNVELPSAQVGFVTGANNSLGAQPTVLDLDQLQRIPKSTYGYFEPLVTDPTQALRFRQTHNEIAFYTWGRRECCLLAGSTQATLLDQWLPAPGAGETTRALNVLVGDVLIFEEVLGARTGVAADADPKHRWAVRVTRVQAAEDPLYPISAGSGEIPLTLPTPLVEITWAEEDALPFSLCISAIGAPPDCTYLTGISVARGNIVLVDHGRTLDPEPLDPVPGETTASCCECEGEPADVIAKTGRYRPTLRKTPLTFHEPEVSASAPATHALTQDPKKAVPAIRLSDADAAWTVRQDLLASGGDDRDFAVEIDNDAVVHLRFGDGELGRSPTPGSKLTAVYRVGCGAVGNVGAEAISHFVLKNLKLDGISIAVRNPLPALGGIDPESIAEAKLFAPHDFRDPAKIQRAITAEDYATLAKRNTSLQGASARLAWTGSWYEADVAVDPLHAESADEVLLETVRSDLHKYRRMGHDLRVRAAVYVPIELSLSVCALPGYDRGHVKAALLARFSNRINTDGTTGFFHPDKLGFGDDVYLSRIVAAAQSVPGVQCLTVEKFYRWFEQPNNEIANGVLPLSSNEIAQLDNDPDYPEHGQLQIMVGGGR